MPLGAVGHMSRPVKCIERDFADGSLFGELWWKLNLLQHPEDEGFIGHPVSEEDKRQNLARSAPVMATLGVPFSPETITGLLNADRVTALTSYQQILSIPITSVYCKASDSN